MQWNREGANAILQIRTSLSSNTLTQGWKIIQRDLYKEAA